MSDFFLRCTLASPFFWYRRLIYISLATLFSPSRTRYYSNHYHPSNKQNTGRGGKAGMGGRGSYGIIIVLGSLSPLALAMCRFCVHLFIKLLIHISHLIIASAQLFFLFQKSWSYIPPSHITIPPFASELTREMKGWGAKVSGRKEVGK